MITTAEGLGGTGGGRAQPRRVTLGDMDGLWAAEAQADADLLHRSRRTVLAYGLDHCLTPRQQQMVRAYYYEGKTQEELARELGVAPSTVCRHLQAARRRLTRLALQTEVLRTRDE